MWLTRVMHEEVHLLYRICQVRTSQRKVLKSIVETLILRGISDGSTICGRELVSSADRCRGRATLEHVSLLKKVDGVLALRQKQPVEGGHDRDIEEVVKIP